MKNYCDFHLNYKNTWRLENDPRKDCSRCQSITDQRKWSKENIGHVPGKWCKERNHCPECCEVRHCVRVLRHYGVAQGTCSPKKCPVCEWIRDPAQRHEAKFLENPKARKRLIVRLYKLMLGYKSRWGVIGVDRNGNSVYGKI